MDELEDKYIKFIDTYLSSKNLTETCKKLKITRSTAYRYLKEDIVKDPKASPQVKINAINSIFSNCNKLTETNDILTKIASIEERLAEQEQTE